MGVQVLLEGVTCGGPSASRGGDPRGPMLLEGVRTSISRGTYSNLLFSGRGFGPHAPPPLWIGP